MNAEKTFQSVSKVLKENGIFAFNLPDQFFNHLDFEKESKNPVQYDTKDLIKFAGEAGLQLIAQSVKTYSKTVKEIIAFNNIPVISKNFGSEAEKEEYISRLKSLSPTLVRKQQWVYFLFKKTG